MPRTRTAWRRDGRGNLTVTNWNFVNPFGGTVSSYRLAKDDKLIPISTVPAPGHPCWNVITDNDELLYTTQPAGLVIGTPQIAVFAIGHDGTLRPRVRGRPRAYNAVDEALSHDSRYLYVLNDGLLPFIPQSAISEFRDRPGHGSANADRRGRPARQRNVGPRGLVARTPVEALPGRSLHRRSCEG